MRRLSGLSCLAFLGLLLLSACHSVPKHARYIPKDASVVVGLNTGEISKKVAWSVITGSKLLDDMKESAPDPKSKAVFDDISNCGIDWMNTLYFYARPDKRFSNSARMNLVAPLDDAKKWEAFIKKTFPTAAINKVKDRNEALLDNKVYAAWTGDVVILMNTITQDVPQTEPVAAVAPADIAAEAHAEEAVAIADTLIAAGAAPAEAYAMTEKKTDLAATVAEMEMVFTLPKESSILENNRFSKLEKEGHDISLFVSYDALMDNAALKDPTGGMLGMMLNGSLWKNSAMATGVDFENGKIVADMLYYPSDSMRSIAKAAGKDNVDKDMLGRIPGQQLNLAMAYHLSPEAMKMLLDKMGLSGMANMFLMQKSTSVDDILGAFTGDLAFAINDFSMTPETVTPDSMGRELGMTPYESTKPKMTMVFAMKLKDKTKFDKLVSLLNSEADLKPSAPNTYTIPLGSNESVTILTGEHYLVASNKIAAAQAFLQRKGNETPELVGKEIAGHPIGTVVDFKSLMANMKPGNNGKDSIMMNELRGLLASAAMSGGEFKGNANSYHFEIRLVNQSENSLLQLLHLAQRMAQLKKQEAVTLK